MLAIAAVRFQCGFITLVREPISRSPLGPKQASDSPILKRALSAPVADLSPVLQGEQGALTWLPCASLLSGSLFLSSRDWAVLAHPFTRSLPCPFRPGTEQPAISGCLEFR